MPEAEPILDPDAGGAAPADLDLVLLLVPERGVDGAWRDARIEFANEAWKSSFGAAGRDLAGVRLLEAFPAFAGPAWQAIADTASSGRELRRQFDHPHDPSRSASVQFTSIGDRVLVVARERLPEDALREALRSSDARFRTALELVPETISILAPQFDRARRFRDVRALYLNRTARERWYGGRALEDLLGIDLFAAYPFVAAQLHEIYREVAETGRTFEGIRRFRRADGSDLWADLRVVLTADGILHTSRDVTATQVAIQELERHRAALADAQRIAHVGSWIYDPVADKATWSDELYRIFGLEPGGPAPGFDEQRAWITPASQAAVERAMADATDHGSPYEIVIDIVRPDGDRRHAIARGESFRPSEGGPPLLRGTLADITELERSRAALQASEERFSAVVNTVQEAIAMLSPLRDETGEIVDHEIEWTNDAWRERTAPDGQDPVGRRAFSIRPEFRQLLPVHRRVLATGVHESAEFRLSSGRWLSVTFTRLGERMLAVSRDVTDARVAEELERARLVAAIEQTSESVLVMDADWRLIYVNAGFERATGFSREEALGRNPRELLRDESDPAVLASLDEAIERGDTWSGELLNRRKDGTLLTEATTTSPVRDAHGAIVAFVSVKRDVTTERALEAQLRQAQRLESIGQLAGGVAHDFNNVLAAIRGYGEFVQQALEPGSEAREDMDQVMRAAERAAALTRQLLAFSRRLALEPQVIDATAVIDDLAPMLRRLLGEHIELRVTHDPSPPSILADPSQLEQVIVNLAVNARDAMPDGGSLEIRTGTVDLGDAEEAGERLPGGAHLRIAVGDSGTGMPPETLARIFEPFFTTKDPGKGTGMGLATVFGIVRASRGRITATSTPGAGTTFVVDLPAVAAAAAAREEGEAHRPPARPGERVLVAEDEPAVRSFLVRVLAGLGYDVVEAASGSEALARASMLDHVDLLLSDVRMPGMQGASLAARLREVWPGVAVLFVSAFADDLPEGVAIGTDVHLLEKPFDAATLARAVRAALDGAPTS